MLANLNLVLEKCINKGNRIKIVRLDYYLISFNNILIDLDLITLMGRKCGNIRNLFLSCCLIGNIGVAKLKESGLKLIDTLDLSHN
jgi:hypothetical protein